MRKITVIVMAIMLAIFISSLSSLPAIKDPESAPNTHVSDYYIEHAKEDTGSPNIVTATLADYRGFDTLGETSVMVIAGLITVLILTSGGKKKGKEDKKNEEVEKQ